MNFIIIEKGYQGSMGIFDTLGMFLKHLIYNLSAHKKWLYF